MQMERATTIASGSVSIAVEDCWNRIGVRGDGTCPKLKQHVHCSYCPVHAAAASALLDREAPPGYLAECTRHIAGAEVAGPANADSAVFFRIGVEWLALPTSVFQEVATLRPIHTLPSRRGGLVEGVTNVRGELLVCVSLSRMLGLGPAAEGRLVQRRLALRRLVVMGLDGQRLGFAVDEMHGIQRFDPGSSMAVPATIARAAATYSKALLTWQGNTVGVLDEQLLFYTLNRSLG